MLSNFKTQLLIKQKVKLFFFFTWSAAACYETVVHT